VSSNAGVLRSAMRCCSLDAIAFLCRILAIVSLGILPSRALAACADYANAIHWLGDVEIPGNAQRVDVSGNYAYVTANEDGLVVVDVSDPAHPMIAGSVDTPGYCTGVEVRDGFAFVAAEGLQVIDVSDPANPLLAAVGGSAYSYDVALLGDFAYMAASWSGLRIVDVSDPLHPSTVGSVALHDDAHAVAVDGGIAYVADGYAGLTIVDVSNPHAPAILGAVDIEGNAFGVAVRDGYVYLTSEYPGLSVINVADPLHPFIAAEIAAYNLMLEDIEVVGARAFIAADALPGLVVVDVSDPLHPSITGTAGANTVGSGVAISGTRAYLTDEYSHLQVIDITHPDAPPIVGAVTMPGGGGGRYAREDTKLCSASYSAGLIVADVSDPANPQVVGVADIPGWAVDVRLSDSRAYVACADSGLAVVDVSVPDVPQIVSRVRNVGQVWAVAVADRYVYLGDMAGYMRILDLAFNPPRVIGSAGIPSGAIAIAVSGSFAYVAADLWGLQIIDVEDPMHPMRVSSLRTGDEARDIALLPGGDGLAIADCRDGVRMVDVSDPYLPTEIAQVDIPGQVHSVAAGGRYVYATSLDTGIWVIDVADPHEPILLGCINTDGDAGDVVLSSECAFVADWGRGLKVLPLQCAPTMDVSARTVSSPNRIRVSPNPAFTDVTIRTTVEAPELGIYDPSGRLIRSLAETRWDRRDDRGRPVAAGLYLVRGKDPWIGSARVLVVR
jgi:hypothetical protein